MAHLLGARSVRLEYPTKLVFDDVSLGVGTGDRIGVVGRNGDGKSSLLKLLSKRIAPDAGQVTWRDGLRLGVLEQADGLDDRTTVGRAITAGRPQHQWAGDPRTRHIIASLAADIDFAAPVSRLSGGQRRRVALAALLVQDWDVIALDEPTNHLDVEAVAWLAHHLRRRWPKRAGGLLLVTHDRWLLDEVATTTWEVHDRRVEPFEGGYAAYVLQRLERDRRLAASQARRQNLLRKELAWLRRGPPARTAKPKFRIEAANQLIADVPPPRDRVELARLASARLGKEVVELVDVGLSFDGHEVLRQVEWRLAPGERSAVLGANGAGKSSLLGLIAGALTPTTGRVKRGKSVRLALLDQRFAALAQWADEPVRQVLARARHDYQAEGKTVTPTQLLELLGFSPAHLSAKVGELSGGQQRRLQLLLVLLDEPNVLLIDEPTNDVDIDLLAALEDLLDSWPGSLVVVSHDRYLVERVTDQQYAIIDGRLRHLPGGIDQYLRLRAGQSSAPTAETPAAPEPVADGPSGAQLRTAQKELASLERRMAKLQERIDGARLALADHDQSDYVGLGLELERIADLEAESRDLESRWYELGERLEAAATL
ncbi:MAG: ABC-F family ATP-binding cassette domain-containing protein [Propionibacteriaceae bacterium]|nr:ABC-F family ATP-binding cassette domain-containing protein [Propionibacteriaceae bacterium]